MTKPAAIDYAGVFTALVTPFRAGKIDFDAFAGLIESQIEAGVKGVVPAGTTGECATLSNEEHLELIRFTVEVVAGRVTVIAGTGANSTAEAIQLTQEAEALGADASLQVTPYYNKPNQEGLYRHFKSIAGKTSLEIMLYSVPGRCGVEIEPKTARRLARDCANVRSIKEAGGDPQRVLQLKAELSEGFPILSGDDPLTIEFMDNGACGLVSVAANLIPGPLVDMVATMQSGDREKAKKAMAPFADLVDGLMSLDSNPMPIKAAMAELNLISPELRLPLTPLGGNSLAELRKLLARARLTESLSVPG